MVSTVMSSKQRLSFEEGKVLLSLLTKRLI